MARPVRHRNKWRIRWIDAEGKRRSAVFIKYGDAEKALRRFQTEADAIKAGILKPPPKKYTFEELADHWMTHRASKKRSPKNDKGIIRKHLRPFFADCTICQINTDKLDQFKTQLVDTCSPKTQHNILTLLIAMLNMAVDLEWIEKCPKIKKPKIKELDYNWLKSDREIRLFLYAAKEVDSPTFEFYATAVYTGMRAGEICGLLWDDVDFENRLITVQRSYDGPTKTGHIRRVPILDPLLPILRTWRLKCPFPIVFPNAAGKIFTPSARILQERFQSCLKQAGLPRIRFHDLRHTFASHWMMKGGDIYKLQKILGHQDIRMTQRYSHLSPLAFQDDFSRVGKPLVENKQMNVIPGVIGRQTIKQ